MKSSIFFFFFEVSGVSGHVLRVRLYTPPKSAMNLGAAVKRIYRKMFNANEYKLNLSNKKKKQGKEEKNETRVVIISNQRKQWEKKVDLVYARHCCSPVSHVSNRRSNLMRKHLPGRPHKMPINR